ncbi:alpha/beta hydrolase [Rhizobium rhizogenes]|uniref:3-oxoadipate enol-lactone hydrolase/4-carboxymuconolactone decarboxylase protein n=1 Tax=Rhizobium rhizogenes (strain K84 / ATCC BAA-868) TaxID=311403 RepID=B9JMN1_RHIR8|nr:MULTISPECIES: alpha/beta hydrolase [Rhizobium]ACM28812.1 3-oxoadipate enol-lactone hydrolase/4-carboxymuconolactone decarboxylase protein [Rhizobium rhizogenes K84]OCJ18927.1 3-oxoadipate enol-lactone hydrolase [Agrobacterium sp. B131/95]EJK88109.1 putative hydrolase or acyltransferase of alpha/beta superfamily [Rhizobium sp. AP16]NTI24484.1 alpha/beta hydrolase [Rhizobium rhizogenes]NTI43804.1 alpha/beta hydrolase [Rhizobium rhizogenes]
MSTSFEHHTVRVKDIRMHYVRAGKGEPLVLLHGWPQNWASWKRIIPVLSDHFTVIAPDMRGFGATSKAEAGYDTNNVADDIRELVGSLGFERIFLAGHDWGAAVAYSYAAQFQQQVRKLAIFEMVLPGFGIMEEAMTPQPNGNFLWHMGFQSVPDIPFTLISGREDLYLRWFFQTYAYDPSAITSTETEEYVQAMTNVGALRAGLQYYQSYFTSAAQNAQHKQHKLTIPVSAWAGEACLGPLTKQCLDMAATDVTGGVIERCGHWIGEERPDFVASQLVEFFGSGG